MNWEPLPPPRPPSHNGWSTLGIATAVAIALFGLVVLAVIVVFVAGMSSYGSNK
jgi:hypothetical protein